MAWIRITKSLALCWVIIVICIVVFYILLGIIAESNFVLKI